MTTLTTTRSEFTPSEQYSGIDNPVEALLSAAANLDRERVRDMIELYAVPVDATTGEHPTALCYAAWLGDWWLCNFLLRRGADATYVDVDGFTPLHYAAWGGSDLIVASLVAHGADVNAANSLGHTPLCLAVSQDAESLCADLLYRHGGRAKAGQAGPKRFH